MFAVKVVPLKTESPVVNATDPSGKNAGPSPNSAKAEELTDVTWKREKKVPVPPEAATKAPPSSVTPETSTLPIESLTRTLPPAVNEPVIINPTCVSKLAGPVLPLT